MRLLPRSKPVRVVVGVVLVALALGAYLARDVLWFAAKLAVPAPAYSAAERRTSAPAPVGPAIALPQVDVATREPGDDPTVDLGELVALDRPSAVADLPGPGPILVSTLDGRVHSVDLATGATATVLDLTDRVSTGGERGLLGIAVDPAGERLYVDYTDADGDTDIRSWPLDADGLPDADAGDVLHLEIGQPFPNHNGGNLVFGPDGALWVATGDGGGAGDRGEVAQDGGSVLGKMLRVVPDPAGGVTAPRSDTGWERPEIWGIGLRNPWRWSFDRETNRLWVADVGQNTIEEVSVADPDEPTPDFGWDLLEGDNRYEGDAGPGLIDPAITYGRDAGCSVTGGYVYRGNDRPGLYGWYLFADYCGGWIRAVPADDPEREPVELASDLGGVISFGELDDGELVVLTTDGLRALT